MTSSVLATKCYCRIVKLKETRFLVFASLNEKPASNKKQSVSVNTNPSLNHLRQSSVAALSKRRNKHIFFFSKVISRRLQVTFSADPICGCILRSFLLSRLSVTFPIWHAFRRLEKGKICSVRKHAFSREREEWEKGGFEQRGDRASSTRPIFFRRKLFLQRKCGYFCDVFCGS